MYQLKALYIPAVVFHVVLALQHIAFTKTTTARELVHVTKK